MKIVHITPEYGAPNAYCGHRVVYLGPDGSGSAEPGVGWSVVGYMEDYDRQEEVPWGFCEECLTSSDYALYLLGEVG
jgi:hypothetical protein